MSQNLQQRVQRVGLFLGPVLALALYLVLPETYANAQGKVVAFSQAGRATLAMMAWMATWWMTEAVDIEVTALLPIAHDAPILADGLKGRAAPMVVLAAAGGLTTMTLLWTRRYAIARLSAVVAVTAVVSGWGLGQYPWLLVDQVTIADAAGATATLKGLLVAVGLAVVIVVPPLAYLLRLTQTEAWSRH